MLVLCLTTGVVDRYFREQLKDLEEAPFDTWADSLLVAYHAPAEMDCFIQIGWPLPSNVLDLYVEFQNATNGLALKSGDGLIGTC